MKKTICKNIQYPFDFNQSYEKFWNLFRIQWLWKTIKFYGLYMIFFLQKEIF